MCVCVCVCAYIYTYVYDKVFQTKKTTYFLLKGSC